MSLTTDRTHLFRGARLRLRDAAPALSASPCAAVVLFSDGARAEAELAPDGTGFRLRVQPYRTAAGTDIAATAWQLASDADGALRVTARSTS